MKREGKMSTPLTGRCYPLALDPQCFHLLLYLDLFLLLLDDGAELCRVGALGGRPVRVGAQALGATRPLGVGEGRGPQTNRALQRGQRGENE